MTIQRMDHVGIVVEDLAAATAFFVVLGTQAAGRGNGRGRLGGPRGGRGGDRDAPANTPGIRHVTFAVDDIDAALASVRARGGELVGEVENYQDIYRLCYVRGPEGIIVELAERIG